MKKALPLLLLLTIFVFAARGQGLTSYRTEPLHFPSRNLDDTLLLDLTLPLTLPTASEKVSLPLIVLFDSYNENTHRYNLQSIDILSYHSQMPESLVVGIPFDEQNRRYLTSPAFQPGDSIAGIEKMERFLFEELIPFLKAEYQAAGPVLLLGHSRTGFLTSYLMVKRHGAFDLAGSFSAFWENGFQKSDLEAFVHRVEQGDRPFYYYFSAGSRSKEEATYHRDLQEIANTLAEHNGLSRLHWQFTEHPFAGHMMNYNLSVPQVLIDYFGPYSSLLTTWVFEKSNANYDHGLLAELMSDFEQLQNHYGAPLQPELVHLISIGNACLNREDFQSAYDLFHYGLECYPGDYDLHYLYVLSLNGLEKKEEARTTISRVLVRIQADTGLSAADKAAFTQAFEELMPD